jgi:hypothetical protein
MWNARTHEAKKVCSGMKHALTSGSASPILRVALVWESQIFKALVKKENKHQFGPPRYH